MRGGLPYKYYMRLPKAGYLALLLPRPYTRTMKERVTASEGDRHRERPRNRLVFMSFVKFYLIFESFMKSLIFVFHASDLHNSNNTHTHTDKVKVTHTNAYLWAATGRGMAWGHLPWRRYIL